MIAFDKLSLSHYLLFHKAEFHFEKGLTFVGGENQSGKSLLFSSLLSGLYSKDLRLKPPLNSKFSFTFDRTLNKTTDSIEFNIATHKTTKYSVFQNGNDLKPHKIADALSLMQNLFILPAPLFVSTVYLRASKEHALLQGLPSQRSEWLSNVLDLVTVYDDYHEQIKKRLDELKVDEIKYRLKKEELEAIELPKMSLSKETFRQASAELDTLRETLQDLTQKRIEISNQIALLRSLPKIKPVSKEVYKVAKQELKENREQLQKLTNILKDWDTWKEETKQREYKLKLEKTIRQKVSKDIKLNSSLLRSLQTEMSGLRQEWEDWKEQSFSYGLQQELREFLKKHENVEILSKTLKKDIEDIVDRQSYIRQHGKTLRNLEKLGSKCPTCGGKLNPNHVSKELSSLEKEWNTLNKRLKALQLQADIEEARSEKLVQKPKPFDSSAIQDTKNTISALFKYLDIEYTDIERPSMSQIKCEKLIRELRESIRSNEKIIENYNQQLAVSTYEKEIQVIFGKGPSYVETQIEKLQAKEKELSESIDKLAIRKDRLQSGVASYEASRDGLRRAKERLSTLESETMELQARLVDVEPLKALMDAFGGSGLRLQQLKESADVLASKMTELSPLFFDDKNPYVFDMQIGPRKLNLDIMRNGIVGPLESTSGSESRFFNLLFGMSLLQILPSRLRTDTIILDELDSMLSEANRDRYTKDILPEVQRHVAKTIVVSPLIDGELKISPTRQYRIVKSQRKGQFQSEIRAL